MKTIDKLNQVDHLCNRLMRSTQHRKNRVEMINSLFRKKGRQQYRFSEDTIQKKITEMVSGKKKTSGRMESTMGEEGSFNRSSTIDENRVSKKKVGKKRLVTISPKKFKTPVS